MGLSKEARERVLSDLKEHVEQGLLCPEVKPSLVGIPPENFVSNGLKFSGNSLPEFSSISRNILDCFAAAVLSIPFIEVPPSRVILRCRLREDNNGELMLCLASMQGSGAAMLPLELTTDGEVWVATHLRLLSAVKGIPLGNIYWDRSGLHSFFFIGYPGGLVRAKVPGLGDQDEDGKPRWPECEVVLEQISPALLNLAKSSISFAKTDPAGTVQ